MGRGSRGFSLALAPKSATFVGDKRWGLCGRLSGTNFIVRFPVLEHQLQPIDGAACEKLIKAIPASKVDESACAPETARFCFILGYLHNTRLAGTPGRQLAKAYWRRGCELGSGHACVYAATHYAVDDDAISPTYRKACALGIPSGCFALAEIGEDRIASAVAACRLGHVHGCGMLEWGEHVALARRMLEPACANGYRAACGELSELVAKDGNVDKAWQLRDIVCPDRDAPCAYGEPKPPR